MKNIDLYSKLIEQFINYTNMPSLIHFRIFGNAVTLTTHSINSVIMLSSLLNEQTLRDPDARYLATMQSRFLTVWNIAFQIVYAILALTCDVMTLMNKDHPKPIKKFREFFFSSIVLPGTLLVFCFFWPIFLYDRSLIYPEFIDKVFSVKSNYVMHIAILPFALWELMFQPRIIPKSHKPSLTAIAVYYVIYNVHIQLTYNELGLWPYPLMHTVYSSVILWISFHVFLIGLSLALYYVQWPIVSLVWGKEKKISEKVK